MGAAPPSPAAASPAAAPAAAGAPPQPQRRLKSSSLMTWRQVGRQADRQPKKQGVGAFGGDVLSASCCYSCNLHCKTSHLRTQPPTHLCGQSLDLLGCHAGAVPHHLVQLAVICRGRQAGRQAGKVAWVGELTGAARTASWCGVHCCCGCRGDKCHLGLMLRDTALLHACMHAYA